MKHVHVLFALLFSTSLFSQSIVTDRPSQTDASSTVGKGVLQIESAFSFMTKDYETTLTSLLPTAQGRQQTFALPTVALRLGICDRLELRLITQPELHQTFVDGSQTNKIFGISDLQAGFKLNILQSEEKRPEVAIISHLLLPTGTSEISGGMYAVINKVAVTHFLTQNHSLSYNVGHSYPGIGNGDLLYSLIWSVSLTDKVGVFVEAYGQLANMDEFMLNGDAGFTYLINNNVQLDYSFGVGITEDMNFHALGLSVRLPKK